MLAHPTQFWRDWPMRLVAFDDNGNNVLAVARGDDLIRLDKAAQFLIGDKL